MTNKLDERIDIQTGSADQSSVDIRLSHQFGDVLRSDAAPIEDSQLRSAFRTVPSGRSIPG